MNEFHMAGKQFDLEKIKKNHLKLRIEFGDQINQGWQFLCLRP